MLVFRKIEYFGDLPVLHLPQQARHRIEVGDVCEGTPVPVAIDHILIADAHNNRAGLKSRFSQLTQVVKYFGDAVFDAAQRVIARNMPADGRGKNGFNAGLIAGCIGLKEAVDQLQIRMCCHKKDDCKPCRQRYRPLF